MYPYVSDMYRKCILHVMYLRVKLHCILNVSLMYRKEGYISLGMIAKVTDANVSRCISMYLDVS
jgi:hypothetical protein